MKYNRVDYIREGIIDGLRVPTEIYSRVAGYLRPVQNWNIGKRKEFEDRKNYNIASIDRCPYA